MPLIVAALCLPIAVWIGVAAGPLAGRLTFMDREWMEALGEKEYLFPLQWPATAWAANLAYVPVIVLIYRRRAAAKLVDRRETGMVFGCLSLVAVFPDSGPAQCRARRTRDSAAAGTRVLDAGSPRRGVCDLGVGRGPAAAPRRAQAAAAALAVLSIVRGSYVMIVEFPDRPLFEVGVRGNWGQVAAWAQATPKNSGWLADPSTPSATERACEWPRPATCSSRAPRIPRSEWPIDALQSGPATGFVRWRSSLNSRRSARQLATEYELDYMVTEQDMRLPLAFQAGAIRVYRLR